MDSRSTPLDGRHALITGAGRGIGAAVARRLHALGARVSLLGRDRARLDALAQDLGSRAAAMTADVTDGAALRRAFAEARAAHGPLAILVNNAGTGQSAPYAKTERALWDRMIALNLTAVHECCQAALPDFVASGGGRIVTVASTAALKGYAYVAAYVAAKHGALGLTRALAVELARHGVTVNAVCPGYTDTDMTRATLDNIAAKTGRGVEAARTELTKLSPLGRLVAPEEVAAAVAWLCLPEQAAVTGIALPVAGGEVG
ncbi:MAG: SDR family oxidoreductase [Alphaproteobacteria bacterium]|nr:SDR family oxidoreductase [Alphaproteobacteria bacterium]